MNYYNNSKATLQEVNKCQVFKETLGLSHELTKVELPSESILTHIRKLVSAIRDPRFEIPDSRCEIRDPIFFSPSHVDNAGCYTNDVKAGGSLRTLNKNFKL